MINMKFNPEFLILFKVVIQLLDEEQPPANLITS